MSGLLVFVKADLRKVVKKDDLIMKINIEI